MRKLLAFLCICVQIVPSWGQSVLRTPNGVKVETGTTCMELECFSSSIIRVKKYPVGKTPDKQSLSVTMQPEKVKYKLQETKGEVILATSELVAIMDIAQKQVRFTDKDGKVLLAEKPSSIGFTPFNDAGNSTYQVRQTFVLDSDEAIYGLGQHQQGRMNQRNQTLFLQQANTEICIPLVHSIKGYALFWDNYSPTTFTDNAEGMTFDSAVGDLCDYYFVYGGGADGVVAGLRELTGQAPMFPLWTYGFWQSRERYVSQDELVGVVRKYRDLKIPLDGIIQDWRYWGEDHKDWNAVEFRNPKFSDPKKMMEEVHCLNAHAIISVWPSFGPETGIYAELKSQNKLMVHETFPQNNGVKVYDTYDPVARDIYWKYMNKNMFSIGMDGWWLDATEPEHGPIKEGDLDFQTYLGSFRKVRNAFPIVSVGGVYDHQRQETSDKRVFILTRSAFAGQQRYAAQAWSGDVVSDWGVLRNQIPAALNISLTGIPYWNSDIGGFFSANKFPEGVKDPAFHELYVRWMQFATFTGMMRSHGTNTPREIFMFGERGYWAFDAQEKMINLRYRLLPYIYSTSWKITSEGGSLMRALFSDFPEDKKVLDLGDEYLFGKSILVAPVTSETRSRSLYLPAGTQWIDFWTGEVQDGGREITRETPVDIIPLYVKAGAIIPVGPAVQFATEKPWDDLQLRIYPGANGEFTLYEDEDDNYNYEKGKYSTIRMTWNDKERKLTIHPRQGSYNGMLQERKFHIVLVNGQDGLGLDNESYTVNVEYQGKKMSIALVSGLISSCTSEQVSVKNDRIVTNPIDLNYRFQPNDESRREAADPVLEYFKGYYYMFASKSGGYWRSEDLAKWEYIPCTTIPTMEDYAPTILVYGDTLYFTASNGNTRIYKNAHPEKDTWEEVDTKFEYPQHDPAFFKDDDERVYFYWGCSDVDPIMGVEVDPKDGFRAIGEPKALIQHNCDKYGWEVPGKNNEEPSQGWNEGPCVLKHNGRYYLQYAAPGTQYRIYGDGNYVGDNPLGPFEYVEDNPFSFKPGGFIGGAGHGHTFKDKYGNYWHVASMTISVRHWFERRLGLFPVVVSEKYGMYALTTFADYPFWIPDRKVDFEKEDISMGWNLLSYKKKISSSSYLEGYEPELANDEQVETWWAAQTGNAGEWLQIDLGKTMEVNAIQVNFADYNFNVHAPHDPVVYQYYIEGSTNGKDWTRLVDEEKNLQDAPHKLHTLNVPAKVQYLKICNTKDMEGSFSLFDLRVFGQGGGKVPAEVTGFQASRDNNDKRIYRFTWNPQENVTGYILRWGTQKEKLTHSMVVYENQYEARYFNRDSEYYFSMSAFNENGVGK